MEKSIAYRKITLAVGILVALLIALTFWGTRPDQETYGSKPLRLIELPSVGTPVVKTFFEIFPPFTK